MSKKLPVKKIIPYIGNKSQEKSDKKTSYYDVKEYRNREKPEYNPKKEI